MTMNATNPPSGSSKDTSTAPPPTPFHRALTSNALHANVSDSSSSPKEVASTCRPKNPDESAILWMKVRYFCLGMLFALHCLAVAKQIVKSDDNSVLPTVRDHAYQRQLQQCHITLNEQAVTYDALHRDSTALQDLIRKHLEGSSPSRSDKFSAPGDDGASQNCVKSSVLSERRAMEKKAWKNIHDEINMLWWQFTQACKCSSEGMTRQHERMAERTRARFNEE